MVCFVGCFVGGRLDRLVASFVKFLLGGVAGCSVVYFVICVSWGVS